jgi:hypothetical protein
MIIVMSGNYRSLEELNAKRIVGANHLFGHDLMQP